MANDVNSHIALHEGNEAAKQWFKGLIERLRKSDDYDWHPITNMFDDWQNIDEEERDTRGWYIDNIGAKWCYIQDADESYISVTSAWSAPEELFSRIAEELAKHDERAILTVTYEDEMPNFFGVSVYTEGEKWDEEYYDSEYYGSLGLKLWWDEEEEGEEEPDDFEPDYEKVSDIQMNDLDNMVNAIKEYWEENDESEEQ